MADKSQIEWTDATWSPITGCSVVSPGCTNCYAMKLAGGRLKHHPSRAGLTDRSFAGPVWNGEVRLNTQWLDQPLRWRKPRMIFVCAHGDLFHESVPDGWIDRIFAVMAASPDHTFQVLTKRLERMFEWFVGCEETGDAFTRICTETPKLMEDGDAWWSYLNELGWPLPNVWLGVSVEDQRRAAERIPCLLDTPASVRFVSVEPLLGSVDLTRLELVSDSLDDNGALRRAGIRVDALRNKHCESGLQRGRGAIDWVIVGGESGPNARPMRPEWARSIRDQCVAAGVPFFFKQWGEWVSVSEVEGPGEHFTFPDGRATVRRVGKKRAGRTLDRREWNEMPDQL